MGQVRVEPETQRMPEAAKVGDERIGEVGHDRGNYRMPPTLPTRRPHPHFP